jgi:lipid-binding SYLF domain-containing protein
LVIISVIEVGFIFSGNVGTGIVLQKKSDGSWSNPSACGLTGIGWGFLVGGSIKDVLVFLMDENALETASGESGVKIGGQAELTFGNLGRTAKLDLNLSSRGAGGTVSVALSRGIFAGLSVEGGVVGARHAANEAFYGKQLNPRQIMSNEVAFPSDKVTLITDVYEKLGKLAEGKTEEFADDAKKAAAKAEADKASAAAASMEGVVKVDASAEASK